MVASTWIGQVGQPREDPFEELLLVHVLRAQSHDDEWRGVVFGPRKIDRWTVRVLLEQRPDVHHIPRWPSSRVELSGQRDELECAAALELDEDRAFATRDRLQPERRSDLADLVEAPAAEDVQVTVKCTQRVDERGYGNSERLARAERRGE